MFIVVGLPETNLLAEGAFDLAEPHLLAAGKRDSARLLADMMAEWSTVGGTPGAFALRGTIPYVCVSAFPLTHSYLSCLDTFKMAIFCPRACLLHTLSPLFPDSIRLCNRRPFLLDLIARWF
jgi:hypothetical protein